MSGPSLSLRRLYALDNAQIEELAAVLIDCVEDGVSVGFMQSLAHARALAFWHCVAQGIAAGGHALLVGEDERSLKNRK
jgi:hypothetical protein